MRKVYFLITLGLSLLINQRTAFSADMEPPPQGSNMCFRTSTAGTTTPKGASMLDTATPMAGIATPEETSAEVIPLYYLRDPKKLKPILDEIFKGCIDAPKMHTDFENQLILYGTEPARDEIKRFISILDLPRERVNLAMWGIVISSKNPKKLAEVMQQVNQEISETQRLLQVTYAELEYYAKKIIIDKDYKELFENLGYQEAFNENRALSMTDIILRINAAAEPISNYNDTAANICHLFEKPEYKAYVDSFNTKNTLNGIQKRPFENFLRTGVQQERNSQNTDSTVPQVCAGNIIKDKDIKRVRWSNLKRRKAVLEFALQYANRLKNPRKFNPESLQSTAENLNSLVNPLVDAINRDIEELFIQPTLQKIQKIVRNIGSVEYAEVGKITVSGLKGQTSTVSSDTISAFDETLPLTLKDLISKAATSKTELDKLTPDLGALDVAATPVPVNSLVSLLAAISEDRTLWRQLTSGLSLTITPVVLRNSTSAELDIDFKVNPDLQRTPQRNSEESTNDAKLRPLSRIKESYVKTKVYVNTLDLFTISSFNSQTTIDGGRSYIPVVGTIWKGVFGEIPVFGRLFSWKNAPKNVQHQSLILTNTFIAPTAMGIAPLYEQNSRTFNFYDQCQGIYRFLNKPTKEPDSGASINALIKSKCELP